MPTAPIVVGTDGSATADRALQRAGEIAAALGAPLHLVTSYKPSSNGARMAAAGGIVIDPNITEEDGRVWAEQVLTRARLQVEGLGVTIETHACGSDPSQALMSIAADHGAQMIVVGNRGMKGARRVLGSVPNRVSHHAECGVLIVPTV